MFDKRSKIVLASVLAGAQALNLLIYSSVPLFPFQWLCIIVATVLFFVIKNRPLRFMTAIVMLLLSGMVFLMDVVSCMFVGHGVPALCLLKFFALASFVYIILSVKLMIDVMSEM